VGKGNNLECNKGIDDIILAGGMKVEVETIHWSHLLKGLPGENRDNDREEGGGATPREMFAVFLETMCKEVGKLKSLFSLPDL